MDKRDVTVSGSVVPGFEPVTEAFKKNFEQRHELGAACCIYLKGRKVVDIWGGFRRADTGEPWEHNTMALVYSTTKGLAGLAMALAHSKGLFDFEERVSEYWPEFAQEGKRDITVRELLSHQAGLFMLDVPVSRDLVADLDKLSEVLARQKPAWRPGSRQAYHAITLGFYESELLRRVDPERRSLGRFFQDEIASPLSLDAYIRLPPEIPTSRLAILNPPLLSEMKGPIPGEFQSFYNAARNPRSHIRHALDGSALPLDREHIYSRNLEIPSGGGVASACGIAQAYSVFATGGRELNLRKETLNNLIAPANPPTHGFHDECLKIDVRFSLGFMKPSETNPFGSQGAFGAPGSGGSFGFADPETEIGYAYVPNQMGFSFFDLREIALRSAMYESLGITSSFRRAS